MSFWKPKRIDTAAYAPYSDAELAAWNEHEQRDVDTVLGRLVRTVERLVVERAALAAALERSTSLIEQLREELTESMRVARDLAEAQRVARVLAKYVGDYGPLLCDAELAAAYRATIAYPEVP